MYASAIINGVLLGGFYALVAMGLSVVFGVLRLINLAHGEIIIGGAYLASVLTDRLGLPLLASVPLVVTAAATAGYLLQRYLLTAMLARGAEGALVATFGLALVAQAVYLQWFTADPRSLPASFAVTGVDLFGHQVRTAYLVAFGIGAAFAASAHAILAHTRIGAVVRAAGADPTMAGLMGHDVRQVYAATFAAAAATAAVAGVMVGVTFSFTPTGGAPYLLIAMAVVVVGGVGSMAGTFVGGLVLGLVQSMTAQVFGGGYRDLAVYLLFFVVLAIRPTGLFGRRPAWRS